VDAISESRLVEVHPELSKRVHSLAAQLDFSIRVTQGIRTVAQQNALWQEGRDNDGNVIGRIVTNAKGTESNHVMGVAVDVVPMDLPDDHPDWDENAASWQRIVVLAPSCGLRDGKSFHDEPHLELMEVPEVPTEEIQSTYLQAGVEAVWTELNIT
jgi:peptidoglycan L-alanyl-D-glutamate endopeptidase CwlK